MGSSKNKTKQVSDTTSSQNQTTSTPGTAFDQGILSQGKVFANKLNDVQAYSGPQEAAPVDAGQGNYAAQWGPTPANFVAQRTTADNPNQTYVDKNYQPAIDAGKATAGQVQSQVNPAAQMGIADWTSILSGPNNPGAQGVQDSLTTAHQKAAANAMNQAAYLSGGTGSFGGYDTGRQMANIAGNLQDSYDAASSNLAFNNYQDWENRVAGGAQGLQDYANTAQAGNNQLFNWGNLGLENQQKAADVQDFNAWNGGTLNDQNAQLKSNEDINQWQAAHQASEAQVADTQGRNAALQQISQTGLDNSKLSTEAGNNNLANQIAMWQALLQGGAMVPGSTSSGTGTSHSNSTTETSQTAAPWQVAAGLGGAALSAFAPGAGLIGQGIKAFMPPVSTGGNAPLLQTPQIPQPFNWGH